MVFLVSVNHGEQLGTFVQVLCGYQNYDTSWVTSMGLVIFLGLINFTTMNFMSYHTEHVQRYQVIPLDELILKIPFSSSYTFFSRDWHFSESCILLRNSRQKDCIVCHGISSDNHNFKSR